MLAGTSKPLSEKLKKYTVCPIKGCWLWTGSKDKDGYGRIAGTSNNLRWFKFAHRASYEVHKGLIPEEKQVLHSCDISCCINPDHLYLGDPLWNGFDKKLAGRAHTKPRFGVDNPMHGRTGELNPMFGKQHTEKSKAKMRATRLAKSIARYNARKA